MRMEERLRTRIDAVVASILGADGEADAEARRTAFDGTPPDARVASYVAKVRGSSSAIPDSEIDALRASLSDDAIFELTLAAALGEGTRRLGIGLGLLRSHSGT